MSDFVQTMKDWRRMCNAQDDGSNRDVCATCPLGVVAEEGCSAIYEGDMDYAKVESVVTKWAAEHPEPVYPTWIEWLVDIGVIGEYAKLPLEASSTVVVSMTLAEPIPADIAQKLGIEPKEG